MPGLVNQGNTCFIASVIQAMAGSDDVVRACRSGIQPKPHGSIGRAAGELILRLCEESCEKGVISPSDLISRIRERYRNIGFAQQDAEEAFLIISGALFSQDHGTGQRTGGAPRDTKPGLLAIAELCRMTEPHRSLVPPTLPGDSGYGNSIIFSASLTSGGRGGGGGSSSTYEGIITPHNLEYPNAGILRPSVSDMPPLQGLLASAVRCATCDGHRELRLDPFSDLSLAIPQRPPRLPTTSSSSSSTLSLSDCLAHWAADEEVEGALCDRCLLDDALSILRARKPALGAITANLAPERRKQLEQQLDDEIEMLSFAVPTVKAHACLPEALRSRCRKIIGERSAGRVVKKLTITRPPAVLALHLRRVLPTLTGFRKDSTAVRFPPVLDIAPFCTSGAGAPGGVGQGAARRPYRLVSVVQHFGDAYGGHYISYRRDARGQGWTLFNDTSVSKNTLSQVLACEAYMLFYEKGDT